MYLKRTVLSGGIDWSSWASN